MFALTGIGRIRVGMDIAAMDVMIAAEDSDRNSRRVFSTNKQAREVSFDHNPRKNKGSN